MWFSPQATKIDPIRKRFQKFVPLLVGLLGFFFMQTEADRGKPSQRAAGQIRSVAFSQFCPTLSHPYFTIAINVFGDVVSSTEHDLSLSLWHMKPRPPAVPAGRRPGPLDAD